MLLVEACAEEVLVLALVAVEDVDVHITRDAADAAVCTELPEGQTNVGFVLAVTGYPDVVTLLDVIGMAHVLVDEHLVDVEDGTLVGAPLYIVHEGAYAPHQFVVATNGIDLCVGGFDVKNWR